MGNRYGKVWIARKDPLACRDLMSGVGVSVQECNGDRFDAVRHEALDFSVESGQVQRYDDIPAECHALADFAPQPTLDNRRWLKLGEVVDRSAPPAPHLQNITETGSRDQANLGAALLNESVDPHCRAVEQPDDLGHRYFEAVDTCDELLGEPPGGGILFLDPYLAGVLIQEHKIDKGPSGVDRETVLRHGNELHSWVLGALQR